MALFEDPIAYIPIEKLRDANWEYIFEQVNGNTVLLNNMCRHIRNKCTTIKDGFDCDSLLKECAKYMIKKNFQGIEIDKTDESKAPWFT